MELNPWSVDNIEVFSFYCCPECIFRSKEQNFFEAHALQNHDQSIDFFLEDNYETEEDHIEMDPEISKLKLETKDDLKQSSESNNPRPVIIPLLKKSSLMENLDKNGSDFHDLKDCESFDYQSESEYHESLKNETEISNVDIDVTENMPAEQNGKVKAELKKFQCRECHKQCKGQKHYDNHKYYHEKVLNGEQVNCEVCNEVVPRLFLKQHLRVEHVNKNENKFKCDRCPYGTYLKINLSSHMKKHHLENKGGLQCGNCGKNCKSELSYQGDLLSGIVNWSGAA